MVLEPTCLDMLVKDKETREPFLFCFPWRSQITSYYLAWEGCVFIYAVDPGFVGPELLQFWRPSPRKRIQNYEYSINYEREYFFRMRKEIKTNYWRLSFRYFFLRSSGNFQKCFFIANCFLSSTSRLQLPATPTSHGVPASVGPWNLSFINFTINLISFLLSL